jgi:hypothetical protein
MKKNPSKEKCEEKGKKIIEESCHNKIEGGCMTLDAFGWLRCCVGRTTNCSCTAGQSSLLSLLVQNSDRQSYVVPSCAEDLRSHPRQAGGSDRNPCDSPRGPTHGSRLRFRVRRERRRDAAGRPMYRRSGLRPSHRGGLAPPAPVPGAPPGAAS